MSHQRILQYHQSLDDTVSDTVKITTLQRLLVVIQEHPDYTYEQYAALLDVGRATIVRNIKKLSEAGYISRVGADKDGYWKTIRL